LPSTLAPLCEIGGQVGSCKGTDVPFRVREKDQLEEGLVTEPARIRVHVVSVNVEGGVGEQLTEFRVLAVVAGKEIETPHGGQQ